MGRFKNVDIARLNYFGDKFPTPEEVQEVLDQEIDENDRFYLECLKGCVTPSQPVFRSNITMSKHNEPTYHEDPIFDQLFPDYDLFTFPFSNDQPNDTSDSKDEIQGDVKNTTFDALIENVLLQKNNDTEKQFVSWHLRLLDENGPQSMAKQITLIDGRDQNESLKTNLFICGFSDALIDELEDQDFTKEFVGIGVKIRLINHDGNMGDALILRRND